MTIIDFINKFAKREKRLAHLAKPEVRKIIYFHHENIIRVEL